MHQSKKDIPSLARLRKPIVTASHPQIAASVIELIVLHNAVLDAHSNCFSGDAVGPDDFANILLEDCKANDASPTDQNILDFSDICITAYKEKEFSHHYIDEADVLLASIDEFENHLEAATPEVRIHFNRSLICDVRAAELVSA